MHVLKSWEQQGAAAVGLLVGDFEGFAVGDAVVGSLVGTSVGEVVGLFVGDFVGEEVGTGVVGFPVGDFVGKLVGCLVGLTVGSFVRSQVPHTLLQTSLAGANPPYESVNLVHTLLIFVSVDAASHAQSLYTGWVGSFTFILKKNWSVGLSMQAVGEVVGASVIGVGCLVGLLVGSVVGLCVGNESILLAQNCGVSNGYPPPFSSQQLRRSSSKGHGTSS